MKLDLVVTGVGMVSPVGHSALQCMHSVRSGITRLYLQQLQDRAQQWISGGGCMLWSREANNGYLRTLAAHALRQAWSGATRSASAGGSRVGLVLGVPDTPRPGFAFPTTPADLERLAREVGIGNPVHQEIVPAGACSAQVGLARADELLRAGHVDACIIGASDSQVQFRVVRWHEAHYRLKCSYLTDGLIPGEAAAFLVVERPASATCRRANVYARIASVAIARETATILGDEPNSAAGLTAAVATCLGDGAAGDALGMVWSDLNGESYRAREWAFTEIRCRLPATVPLLHPADCYGDLGAASDANLLALASLAQVTGWSQGAPSLVFSGSEGGLRAATIVAAPEVMPASSRVTVGIPRLFSDRFTLPAAREPDYEASTDPQRDHFQWLLGEEHRDEIAALHYQRRAILNDPELEWTRLEAPEQRLLNHLDAAVAGGSASMASVAAGIESDEEGLVFAGASMLALCPSEEHFGRLRRASQQAGAAWRAGVRAALTHAPGSKGLESFVSDCVADPDPAMRSTGWHLAAQHRSAMPRDAVAKGLRDQEPEVAMAAVEYIAFTRLAGSASLLAPLLKHGLGRVRAAAVHALLVCEKQPMLSFARAHLRDDEAYDGALSWALGIGGEAADAAALIAAAQADATSAAPIIAMGVHGAGSLIDHLLGAALSADDEARRDRAVQALALLGGELASPAALAADIGSVRANLYAAAAECPRLRGGQRWTLEGLVDALQAPASSLALRRLAQFELRVWSEANIEYEPEWFVARQRRGIAEWRRSANR